MVLPHCSTKKNTVLEASEKLEHRLPNAARFVRPACLPRLWAAANLSTKSAKHTWFPTLRRFLFALYLPYCSNSSAVSCSTAYFLLLWCMTRTALCWFCFIIFSLLHKNSSSTLEIHRIISSLATRMAVSCSLVSLSIKFTLIIFHVKWKPELHSQVSQA